MNSNSNYKYYLTQEAEAIRNIDRLKQDITKKRITYYKAKSAVLGYEGFRRAIYIGVSRLGFVGGPIAGFGIMGFATGFMKLHDVFVGEAISEIAKEAEKEAELEAAKAKYKKQLEEAKRRNDEFDRGLRESIDRMKRDIDNYNLDKHYDRVRHDHQRSGSEVA